MLTLILDRTHACLLEEGRVPGVEFAGGPPLRAVEAHLAARGVTLPAPAGSRARGDGRGRDFVFVTERFAAPAGMDWRPLREAGDDVGSLYLSYDDWREAHEAYFAGEAGSLGLSFDERALISVERFEVLHIVGCADVIC